MLKKIILVFVLFFIILVLAIAFIGPRLINTNKIKNKITGNIREKYNYEVEIDSVRISLFLGLKARLEGVGARSLAKDRYGFDVKAETLEASIKLIPLLRRKIEIGCILIDEPVFTLEEKKLKAEEAVGGNIPPPIISKALPAEKKTKVTASKSPIESLSISGLIIRKGKIRIKSEALLSERINDVELSDIALSAAPLAFKKPMKVKLRGRLAVNEAQGERGLFLRPVEIALDQKIVIEEETIKLEELRLGIESISIFLSGVFSNFEAPLIEARLSTGEVNLDSLKDFVNFNTGQSMNGILNFEGTLAGPLEKYSRDNLKGVLELKEAEFAGLFPNAIFKMNGKLDLTSSSILKEALSGNFNKAETKGKLSISHGTFNKIAFQELSSGLNFQNDTMVLSPVKFSLYDGLFNGVIRATAGEVPDFNFSAEVKDISIEKFLADTSTLKDTIYGRLYSQLEVKGKGKDLSRINQTMTGNMHVEMREGKITTLNLLRDILSVAGLLTGMRPPQGDYTSVDVLTADAVISDGKAVTDNLHLVSKGMEVVGKGDFSFDQRINFIMDAYVGAPREQYESGGGFLGKYMTDKFGRLVVPIRVTGTVTRPHVYLDTRRLTANIFDQEIKDLLPKIFK